MADLSQYDIDVIWDALMQIRAFRAGEQSCFYPYRSSRCAGNSSGRPYSRDPVRDCFRRQESVGPGIMVTSTVSYSVVADALLRDVDYRAQCRERRSQPEKPPVVLESKKDFVSYGVKKSASFAERLESRLH